MASNADGFLNTIQMVRTLNLCISWDIGLTNKKKYKNFIHITFFSSRKGYYVTLEI